MNGAVRTESGDSRSKRLRLPWLTWPRAMLFVAAILIPALIWLGRSKPATPDAPTLLSGRALQDGGEKTGAAIQANEGGGVTLVVEWAGKEAASKFKVTMDTHSVDLDGYDLTRLSTLRTDDEREAEPLTWDAPKGGHHRQGTLTFANNALDGKPLIGPNTKSLELVIYDVAGVAQRSFKWVP